MIEKEVFAQQFALLADRIGRPLAGPTQAAYYRQLSAELTTEQFVAAMTLAFRKWNGEYRNWPCVDQILELITPVEAPTLSASEAFEAVLAVTNDPRLAQAERRAKVQEMGAATMRAFLAAGGMRDFTDVLEADVTWLRKRFVEHYVDVCEHATASRQSELAIAEAEERVHTLIANVAKARAAPPERQISRPS